MIANKMHVQQNIIFSDGRVWTSLSELVKIEQKLDQHPVKFISRNLCEAPTAISDGHAYGFRLNLSPEITVHVTSLFF